MEDLALVLKLETPQLFARLHRGSSLLQIAEDQGLSRDRLLEQVMDLMRHQARRLVEKGAMRSEDVERFLEKLQHEFLQEIEQPSLAYLDQPEPQDFEFGPIAFDFKVVAHALDMRPRELHHLLSQGHFLEGLAKERGISLARLAELLIAPMDDKLKHMIAKDRIDPERAHQMLEKMRTGLLEDLATYRVPLQDEPRPNDREFRPTSSFRPYPEIPLTMEDVAQVLGISFEEMVEVIENGGDIVPLLEKRGLTLERFVGSLLDMVHQRLYHSVAQGEISEEKVGHILQELKRRLVADLGGRSSVEPHRVDASVVSNTPFDVKIVADALSLSTEELHRLFSEGHTVADIANKLSVPPDTVVDALIAPILAQIREAIRAGHISEAEAKQNLEGARTAILQAFRSFRLPDQDTVRSEEPQVFHTSLDLGAVARALGLQPEDFRHLLSQGYTVAILAENQGVSLERLYEALLEPLRAKLRHLVEEGHISVVEAERHLQRFEEEIKNFITRSFAALTDAGDPSVATDTRVTSGTAADLAYVLPRLDSVEDVFHLLGVQEKAAHLLKEGLSLRRVAQELGYGADGMHLRLQDISDELLGARRAVRLPDH